MASDGPGRDRLRDAARVCDSRPVHRPRTARPYNWGRAARVGARRDVSHRYASSADGVVWRRLDHDADHARRRLDSEMIEYPQDAHNRKKKNKQKRRKQKKMQRQRYMRINGTATRRRGLGWRAEPANAASRIAAGSLPRPARAPDVFLRVAADRDHEVRGSHLVDRTVSAGAAVLRLTGARSYRQAERRGRDTARLDVVACGGARD